MSWPLPKAWVHLAGQQSKIIGGSSLEAELCFGHRCSILQAQRYLALQVVAMTTPPSHPEFLLTQSSADGKFVPVLDKTAVQAHRPDHRLAEAPQSP